LIIRRTLCRPDPPTKTRTFGIGFPDSFTTRPVIEPARVLDFGDTP
jgi:hypothetical protein